MVVRLLQPKRYRILLMHTTEPLLLTLDNRAIHHLAMRLAVTGSYLGITVSILIDDITSVIASHFALDNHISRSVYVASGGITRFTASGAVLTPTPNGWYRSSFSMPVQYNRPFDIV